MALYFRARYGIVREVVEFDISTQYTGEVDETLDVFAPVPQGVPAAVGWHYRQEGEESVLTEPSYTKSEVDALLAPILADIVALQGA